MLKFFHLLSAAIIFASVGCQHNRVTSTADVSVVGGCIETRNRYRPVCKDYWCGVAIGANELKPYQPNVFAADGIPFTINASSGVFESAWGWTGILCAMTIGALPWIETRHYHTTYTLSFEDKNIPMKSFETCTRRGKAFAWLPLPLLFFNFVPELCFNNENAVSNADYEPENRAVACGLAVRLKELEESGYMSPVVKAKQWTKYSVAENASSFQIVKLERDAVRDFAYRFELAKRGGGNIAVSDYASIRSAFMAAMRSHYANEHKDVNPRTLAVDFPEYSMSGGRIVGVVVVLSITPQLVTYNATTRIGRIAVKIGDNQFEDARRWMRKNIEAIAQDSNVAKEGDEFPEHARFYIGGERLDGNGVFEIDFKTE